jgi:hypothetical protein
MAKIRNDIPLQALSAALTARMNAAGRPMLAIPLTEEEKRVLPNAKVHALETEAESYDGILHKVEGVLRPEYMVQTLDLFRGAEVREVDASDWHGDVGQEIRVHAADAAQVTVVICDGDGLVIEQGAAIRTAGDIWMYTTIATATDGPRLVVVARSLPEHLAEVRLGE